MRTPAERSEPGAGEPAWLQVYGDELVGAKVSVDDGKYTGYSPNKIAVPPGKHRVIVEPRGGAPLPAKQIELSGSHTQVSPLRLTW